MRPLRLLLAIGLLAASLCSPAAAGPVSTGLAETGGFLLGNASRCGVAADRVTGAGRVISGLIAAAARDRTEQQMANRRFAAAFRANAEPDRKLLATLPLCPGVIRQFETLERHYREIGLG
jgi:hypothetical protein